MEPLRVSIDVIREEQAIEVPLEIRSSLENRITGTDGMVEVVARMVLEAGVFERNSETSIRKFTLPVERNGDTRDDIARLLIPVKTSAWNMVGCC